MTAAPALCLVTREIAEAGDLPGAVMAVEDPKRAFAQIAGRLHVSRNDDWTVGARRAAGVSPDARLAEDVKLGEEVVVGPFASIGAGVEIGAGSRIGPGAVISHATIGERAVIGPGAVIGEPGFGFVEEDGRPVRMPQLGHVEIGDEAEVGAHVAIDRGALGPTVVGDGVKIDNLVQVAHNARIGQSTMIAAQVGLAGGAEIGAGVMMGGHSGVGNNVVIGDGARLGSMSGFMRNVPPGETWGGLPAMPTHLWWRSVMFLQRAARKNLKQKNDD